MGGNGNAPLRLLRRFRILSSKVRKYASYLADSILYRHSTHFLSPVRGTAASSACVHSKETSPQMLTCSRQIQSLRNLRDYVNETLCNQNQLELDAFQISERILVRGEEPCGIYFCLHGPRAVKFTAIWETDRNTVLFYDCQGERCQTTQLIDAPCLQRAA